MADQPRQMHIRGQTEIAVVIPARYHSVRFPGKPLAHVGNKPLIQHVYERIRPARGVTRVVVATDDERIRDVVTRFGGDAILTSSDLRSGSDRVAAVARELPADVYVNFQGDEIPLSSGLLEDLILPFTASEVAVGTLKRLLTEERELLDPNVVKVVTDRHGDALYFSRSPIPFVRDVKQGNGQVSPGLHWKHVGIYAYTRTAVAQFAALPAGTLEGAEQLEQLRLLEAGIRIQVWETRHHSLRIDTPADLERAERILTTGELTWQNSSL